MSVTSFEYRQIFRLIKNARPQMDPNPGFRDQLKAFEKEVSHVRRVMGQGSSQTGFFSFRHLSGERVRLKAKFGLRDDEDRSGDNKYVREKLDSLHYS